MNLTDNIFSLYNVVSWSICISWLLCETLSIHKNMKRIHENSLATHCSYWELVFHQLSFLYLTIIRNLCPGALLPLYFQLLPPSPSLHHYLHSPPPLQRKALLSQNKTSQSMNSFFFTTASLILLVPPPSPIFPAAVSGFIKSNKINQSMNSYFSLLPPSPSSYLYLHPSYSIKRKWLE